MMGRLVTCALSCTLLALAAGCSSPAVKYYTLSAVAAPASATSQLAVAVGPVAVPSVVDRAQIVVTTSANQVTVDDFNRWASPVQDSVERAVAENLVALLGTQRVTLFESSLGADAEYRVQIEVRNFESAPGKYASLDAVWTVRRLKDRKTETGRTTVREQVEGEGYEALAAAHSRGIAKMSREIADKVRMLASSTS